MKNNNILNRKNRGVGVVLKTNNKHAIMKVQINTISYLTHSRLLSVSGMVQNRKTQRTRYSGRVLRCAGKLAYGSKDPPGGGLFVWKKLFIN